MGERRDLAACEPQVLAGFEFLGDRQVQSGLRLIDIGARAGARGDALAGGIDLRRVRRLLRQNEVQAFLCQKGLQVVTRTARFCTSLSSCALASSMSALAWR